ncbi:hypothetical protein [Actinomadura sp. 9N407]|uniref:hypothetical protein n=1 Tax=Actinomadura sp. 9N407 TaxID=3375154 RepID=UPI003790D9B8
MRMEHPRTAAERVTEFVSAIGAGLAGRGELSRAPGDVSPQPCDHVAESRSVSATYASSGGNPYLDPWYVDYSPYNMMYIGYADIAAPIRFASFLAELGARLAAGGWRVYEPESGSGGGPELMVEAPVRGYGGKIGGILGPAGRPRVTVIFSSPCLRHPNE